MSQSRKQFFVVTIIFILIISISLTVIILNAGTLSSQNNNPPPSATPTPTATAMPTASPSPTSKPTTLHTSDPTQTQASANTQTETPPPTAKPTQTPLPPADAMPSIDSSLVLFGDNFQSGNMSAWTKTDTSGVNLNIKNSMLQCQANTATNQSWGYLYKWLDQNYSSIYWRWYIYFSNLPATEGNIIGAGGIYNSAVENRYDADYSTCSLNVVCQNGAYHWQLGFTNSSKFCNLTDTKQVQAETWYLVELKAIQGAGDGEAHFYLNNVETLNATGLTNNNNAGIDHVSIGGGITADQPITWYCCAAVAAQTYIGPEPSASTLPSATVTALGSSAFNLYATIAAGVILLSTFTLLRALTVSANKKAPILHAKLVASATT